MKYMLLMTTNAKAFDDMADWSPEQVKEMLAFMGQIGEELAASGELVDAQGLTHPNQAKIVQAQPDGEPVVTDGPFPEAKEFLAGYWLVDVHDEARAVEITAKISAGAGSCPMVMHPVGEAPEIGIE
jgi:hypothetical protein